jgi:hypothetical protein
MENYQYYADVCEVLQNQGEDSENHIKAVDCGCLDIEAEVDSV